MNKKLIGDIENRLENDVLHVIPTNDVIEHAESEYCKCNPTKLSDCEVWVHDAIDGRQVAEQAKEILNDR